MKRRNFLQWMTVGAAGLVIPNARVWSFPKEIKRYDGSNFASYGGFIRNVDPLPDSIFVNDPAWLIPEKYLGQTPIDSFFKTRPLMFRLRATEFKGGTPIEIWDQEPLP